MRIALVYPPSAYSYMPYLAPFLLQGYLHEKSSHTAKAIDLNAQFQEYTRSERYLSDFADIELDRPGDLLRQLVRHHAQSSFDQLRRAETYADWRSVREHSRILDEVGGLVRRTDRAVRAGLGRPGSLAEEVDSLTRLGNGRFLSHWIRDGGLDGFDALGITVTYQSQLLPALVLARLVKQTRAVPVILGGGAVTHVLQEILASPEYFDDVDCIVPYEGEAVLVEILDALEAGAPLPAANVAYVSEPGGAVAYRENLLAKPRTNPVPSFADLRAQLYPTPTPIYPLLTSKGCYWGKCAFCTHHEGYGQGYYRLTDESVENSISHVASHGGDHFYFVDEAIPPRQFQQLTHMFSGMQGGDYAPRWMAEARLERGMARPTSIEMLEAAGCVLLVNGIESGCQAVVDKMDKGIDLKLVEEFAALCRTSDSIRTGWMFFVGFPGESHDQARATFEFIRRNLGSVDYTSIGAFSLERGSPIWNDPERYGITAIHGRDDPKANFFEYDVEGFGRRGVRDNEKVLADLRDEFPEVQGLTSDAVDRAFAMFRAPRSAEDVSGGAPLRFTWDDADGNSVTYFAENRRFEVAK